MSSSNPAEAQGDTARQRKILLVDDNQDILKILTTKLEVEGFLVFATKDAVSGIIKAKAELPDLIIMDVMMPVTDGIEALKRLKAIPETRDIPIIMLTAKRQKEDVIRAIQAGAKDYIVKPIDFARLLEKIEKNLPHDADTAQLQILQAQKVAQAVAEAEAEGGVVTQGAEAPAEAVAPEETLAIMELEAGGIRLRLRMRRGVMHVELLGTLNDEDVEPIIRHLTDVVEFDTNKLILDISGLTDFHWFKVETFLRVVEWLENLHARVKIISSSQQNYQAMIRSKVKYSILRHPSEALDLFREEEGVAGK